MTSPTSSPSASSTGTPAAGRYEVDPARSTISFNTRHLFGLGGVAGTFRLREAELVVGEPTTSTTLRAVVDAGSVDTSSPQRDTVVTSPKFLDTDTHPDITVTGTGLEQRDGRWVATGTVRARGVEAPLELLVEELQERSGVLTVRATTRIDRYAHGVTAGKGMAGRWLKVTLDAVATRSDR